MTDAVEKVARLLDPQSWLVMDEGLASMLRKHKGQNIGFDPENFKHPPSIKRANEIINTLETLGWLSPDQLAIRDAETTRRALEMAAKHIYDNFQDPIVYLAHDAILALQPAPTGWKLVPEELPAENNKKAVKLALSATVLNWPDYMNSLYRAMIGSVK